MILSAGIIPIRVENDCWEVMFLRAYRNWDFPKGIVEPGETPLQAALRESREEAGLGRPAFRWGPVYRETAPYGKKIARYYPAVINESRVTLAVNPDIGKPEHHEYRWCPPDELFELAPARLQSIAAWVRDLLSRTPMR